MVPTSGSEGLAETQELSMALPLAHRNMSSWALAAKPVQPDELDGGLRANAVRIGTWLSGESFPWDVVLLRTSWSASAGDWASLSARSRPREDGSISMLENVPALLFVPRPLADYGPGLVHEFESWLRADGAGPTGKDWHRRHEHRWRPWEGMPPSVRHLWAGTKKIVRIMEDFTSGASDDQKNDRRSIWLHTPWAFTLSQRLIRAEFGPHPPVIDWPDAFRRAQADHDRGGDGRSRHGRPNVSAGSASALEGLVRAGHTAAHAAAFLDGRATHRGFKMGSSNADKRRRQWLKLLADHRVMPFLVPLTEDQPIDDNPDLVGWVLRWLGDGRAHRALWYLLGGASAHLHWTDAPEGRSSGLALLTPRRDPAEIVRASPDEYFGHELRWRKPKPRG